RGGGARGRRARARARGDHARRGRPSGALLRRGALLARARAPARARRGARRGASAAAARRAARDRGAQLFELAGALGRARLVPPRSAAPPAPLPARRAARAGRALRLRGRARASLLPAPEPLRLDPERAEPFAPAAAQRTLHAALRARR